MFDSRTMTAFLTLPADIARAAAEGWQRGWTRQAPAPEASGFAAMNQVAEAIQPPAAF